MQKPLGVGKKLKLTAKLFFSPFSFVPVLRVELVSVNSCLSKSTLSLLWGGGGISGLEYPPLEEPHLLRKILAQPLGSGGAEM